MIGTANARPFPSKFLDPYAGAVLGQLLDRALQAFNQLDALGWQLTTAPKDLLHHSWVRAMSEDIPIDNPNLGYLLVGHWTKLVEGADKGIFHITVLQLWLPGFRRSQYESHVFATKIEHPVLLSLYSDHARIPVPAASQESSASCGRKAATNKVRPRPKTNNPSL